MTTTTAKITDLSIQESVQSELEWTPEVDAAGIGVAVDDGVVSLSGEIGSYAERAAANRAALRVRGVGAVVDDLVSHPKSASWIVTDADIAKSVRNALESTATVPKSVKATVNGGTVTLTGEVQWEFQRASARHAIARLRGVTLIDNRISLFPRPSSTETSKNITEALVRNATVDADRITVTTDGTKVTLTGSVKSWAEKRQAGFAAWASPHVADVDNRITVSDI